MNRTEQKELIQTEKELFSYYVSTFNHLDNLSWQVPSFLGLFLGSITVASGTIFANAIKNIHTSEITEVCVFINNSTISLTKNVSEICESTNYDIFNIISEYRRFIGASFIVFSLLIMIFVNAIYRIHRHVLMISEVLKKKEEAFKMPPDRSYFSKRIMDFERAVCPIRLKSGEHNFSFHIHAISLFLSFFSCLALTFFIFGVDALCEHSFLHNNNSQWNPIEFINNSNELPFLIFIMFVILCVLYFIIYKIFIVQEL